MAGDRLDQLDVSSRHGGPSVALGNRAYRPIGPPLRTRRVVPHAADGIGQAVHVPRPEEGKQVVPEIRCHG